MCEWSGGAARLLLLALVLMLVLILGASPVPGGRHTLQLGTHLHAAESAPPTAYCVLPRMIYTPRSFSFGVVLWELLTWRLPWAGSGLSPFQVGELVGWRVGR